MYEAVLILSLVCFVAVTIVFLRSGSFSVFHPLTLYLLFHGIVFVIRPLMANVLEYEIIYRAFHFSPSQGDKITAILAANVGLLAFAWFCMRSGSVPMQFKLDVATDAERERLKRAFIWVAAICLPIGFYSLVETYAGISSGAGWGTVMDKASGVFINTSSNGWLVESQLMIASCAAIFAWLFRYRVWAIAPLVLFILLRAGTGGRGPFVAALATIGLLWLYEHRQRMANLRASVLIGLGAILFVTIGNDRGAGIRDLLGDNNQVANGRAIEAKPLEQADFANMEFLEYLVYVVPQRSETYGYFTNNLQIFTEGIPRVWWPGKPVGAPFQRIFLFDYGYPIGMTRSLPGEGWFNLGWLGVVIWCGLWGHVLGLLYRKWVEGAQNTLPTLAYLVFLPTLITGYRDGLLITIVKQNGFYLMPIALWIVIAYMLNIPKASEIRAALVAMARQKAPVAAVAVAEPVPASGGDPALAALPPAVRRRRLALAAAGKAQ